MVDYKYDHVHLRSLDPEKASQFYIEKFGAVLVSNVRTDTSWRITVNMGGLPLFIDQVPAGTHGPLNAPSLGFEHIGLVVGDLDAAAAELDAKGVEFTMRPTSPRPGIKISFVKGPDGVLIEVLERSAA
jgi:catechol 2,3-dioxygenase-like lactoylglutathione lyase family enzyme